MPRSTTITVKKIPAKNGGKYQVYLPATLTGGRRIRKFFPSRSDAEMFAIRARTEGWKAVLKIDDKKYPKNAGGNADADRAGDIGFAEGGESGGESGGERTSEVWGSWLAKHEGCADSTTRKFRYVGRRFLEKFGRRRLREINHRELEEWVLGLEVGPATKWDHFRIVRRFFAWSKDFLEVIDKNPFARIAAPAKKTDGALPAVLTVVQMREVLRAGLLLPGVDRRRWWSFVALGGFCGLRSAEIFFATWGDVGAAEVFVRQPKRVRGWMPRYVSLPPVGGEWLALARGGDVGTEDRVFPEGQPGIYRLRKMVTGALGWPRWPQNCLRHSYGTYYLAKNKDLATLRTEMGHESEGVTRAHYAVAARRVDAEAWWGLTPSSVLGAGEGELAGGVLAWGGLGDQGIGDQGIGGGGLGDQGGLFL